MLPSPTVCAEDVQIAVTVHVRGTHTPHPIDASVDGVLNPFAAIPQSILPPLHDLVPTRGPYRRSPSPYDVEIAVSVNIRRSHDVRPITHSANESLPPVAAVARPVLRPGIRAAYLLGAEDVLVAITVQVRGIQS